MDHPRFCSQCGQPLGPNARFCPGCGKPIQASPAAGPASSAPPVATTPFVMPQSAPVSPTPMPPATPASPPAAQDCVQYVLAGGVRHSGFLGVKQDSFVLAFTPQRILFAQQTYQMMQDNVLQARDSARQAGKGFFGQWAAQLGSNQGQVYASMTPQQILAERPENYAIPADEIRSIRLHEENNDEAGASTYVMVIDALGNRERLHFSHLDLRGTRRMLQSLYGQRVR